MPFYEYECTNCKFYVEALQKITDEPLKQCPSCKKQTLKKLVSAPVFRLKGGGWYETDFKSEKEEKRNLADREEAAAEKPADAPSETAKEKDAAKPAAAKSEPKKVSKPAASKPKPKKAAKPAPRAKAKAKPAKAKKRR